MSRDLLPPQHGAWAFLALPLLLAGLLTGPSWILALLGTVWILAYPAAFFVLAAARTRQPKRFCRPIAFWSLLLAPLALWLLTLRPWLIWFAVLMSGLFLISLRYAARNDERSLINDGVLVLQCTLMVPVSWAVATGGASLQPPRAAAFPARVWILSTLCALVLTGSVLHVKSLIRERRNRRYATASAAFALFSLGASAVLATHWGLREGAWLSAPFALLLLRSALVGRRSRPPVVIGLVELAAFCSLLLAVWLATA